MNDSKFFKSDEPGIHIAVDPVPKPRQTRSDKWKVRPVVKTYRDYADILRYSCIGRYELSGTLCVDFRIKMPRSWSFKKKREMFNTPHDKRPDLDNLIKAVQDSLAKNDSHVHTVLARKVWWIHGEVVLY